MAHFKQTFKVDAPLSRVWQLHDDPAALVELTPPPVQVRLIHIDRPLHAGAKLHFWLGMGPLGVHWHAVYDEFEPYQPGVRQCHFVDRSERGPFHAWTHRHTFTDLGDGTSTVTDDARFELFGGTLGSLITWLAAWPAIAFMFLFRRWKTSRMLAQGWRAS